MKACRKESKGRNQLGKPCLSNPKATSLRSGFSSDRPHLRGTPPSARKRRPWLLVGFRDLGLLSGEPRVYFRLFALRVQTGRTSKSEVSSPKEARPPPSPNPSPSRSPKARKRIRSSETRGQATLARAASPMDLSILAKAAS